MVKSAFSSTTALLGTVTSGVALFNFTRQVANVGLNGFFVDLVAFYQGWTFPVLEFVRARAPWMVPSWNPNFTILVIAITAIHAKSVSSHFVLKFEREADPRVKINTGGVVRQIWLGLKVIGAYFGGAESVSVYGSVTKVTAGSMTVAAFLLMTFGVVCIPYVRNVLAIGLMTGVAMVIMTAIRGTDGSEFGAEFLNQRVFAMHYLGAVLGAVVFFVLNRYAL